MKSQHMSPTAWAARNEIAPLPRTGQCTACAEGFVTSGRGSRSCSRCKVGTYRLNESECLACPGRMTTAYQGGTVSGLLNWVGT